MNKPYLFIFSLLILVFTQTVIAEDGKVMEPEETKETQKAPPPQPRNNSPKPLEEFVPSEEISIDRPVTFPVDI